MSLCRLLWATAAAHLGGLVGYRSGAARAELLQPWPGEEQDVLLGEQVSAPERGDGTQGSLQGREEVGRSTQEEGLSGQLPPCSLRPSLSPSKPLQQPHQDPALTARSHLPPPGRPPLRRPPCHPRLLPWHRHALARTHGPALTICTHSLVPPRWQISSSSTASQLSSPHLHEGALGRGSGQGQRGHSPHPLTRARLGGAGPG